MFVKITAKRQVTFPARVLEALGVKPGDRIELEEGPTVLSCARDTWTGRASAAARQATPW